LLNEVYEKEVMDAETGKYVISIATEGRIKELTLAIVPPTKKR
jgi:hypothetical protein